MLGPRGRSRGSQRLAAIVAGRVVLRYQQADPAQRPAEEQQHPEPHPAACPDSLLRHGRLRRAAEPALITPTPPAPPAAFLLVFLVLLVASPPSLPPFLVPRTHPPPVL